MVGERIQGLGAKAPAYMKQPGAVEKETKTSLKEGLEVVNNTERSNADIEIATLGKSEFGEKVGDLGSNFVSKLATKPGEGAEKPE